MCGPFSRPPNLIGPPRPAAWVRVKEDLTGPNPVDRGNHGSKIPLITDRNGLPLSMVVSGAGLSHRWSSTCFSSPISAVAPAAASRSAGIRAV